jgi:signal transduction histidine kinase
VCPAIGVSLEHPSGAALVLARSGPNQLSGEEASLLRGMAHATSMRLRTLNLLDGERAARAESDRHAADNARLLEEQAALRRVATLVAGQVAPEEIFAAVAEEVGRLLRVDAGAVCRYEPDGSMTVVASGEHMPVGTRIGLEGDSVAARVLRTGRSARLDGYEGVSGPFAELVRELGVRSSVGAPIIVDGRVWGAMIAASYQSEPFDDDAESRIMGFTELVAAAISNAASSARLAASRARIVATADETRRRIERDLHDGIQQRLVTLSLELQAVEHAVLPQQRQLVAQLSHLGDGLKALSEELREITRGVHPAILSAGGLGPALKSLARRSYVPVELDVGAVKRLPEPVEVAAYYVASEAFANACKHANASVVQLDLELRDRTLHVAVRDDGGGGADPAQGSGLLGLADRVEALGGTMSVTSPPGQGTWIVVELPLAPRAAQPTIPALRAA